MKNISRGKGGWENPLATRSTRSRSDSKLQKMPTLTPFYYYWCQTRLVLWAMFGHLGFTAARQFFT